MVVKVNRELGEALDLVFRDWDKKVALEYHVVCKGIWIEENKKPLCELSVYEFAEIIFKGYEIEESPEEKLLKFYNKCDLFSADGTECLTIRITLNKLNIKIKGIND